jgi:putative chitinase
MITAEKLLKFAPNIKDVAAHAAALEAARKESTVDNVRRLCAFLGQISVETGGFTLMEENLNYRNPERLDAVYSKVKGIEDAKALIAKGPQAIANRVYGAPNDLGNGDEASGDGWKYRGSGYKQLTGRYNYRVMGKAIGMDLESNPDWVRVNPTAAKVAFVFWDAKHCSPLADIGDIEGITALINGPAKMALAERRAATARALEIWAP